jgi:hypothetical protein
MFFLIFDEHASQEPKVTPCMILINFHPTFLQAENNWLYLYLFVPVKSPQGG